MYLFSLLYGMVSAMWGMTKVFVVVVFNLFAAHVAFAQEAVAPSDDIVHQVEHYFNTLSTYQADFRQVDVQRNQVQQGTFYLNRPKKFLWEYDGVRQQKLVSTGSRLFYVDDEQVTQLPLSFGLAAVLTQPQLRFNGGTFVVEETWQSPSDIGVTLRVPEESGLQPGTVTLTLQRDPLALKQMITTSAVGQKVVVDFERIQQGHALNERLFDYIPPQEEIQFLN